jgi:hypothetical protein
MDQRLTGTILWTLDGIDFTTWLGERPVRCRLTLEALDWLRARCAPGFRGSHLILFHRIFDEVMTIATWKELQGTLEADGSLLLTAADAQSALRSS